MMAQYIDDPNCYTTIGTGTTAVTTAMTGAGANGLFECSLVVVCEIGSQKSFGRI